MRLRHEPLEVVHEPFTAVLRVLVVPPDVNRFLGTHFLTVPAENAAELVDLEHERISVALLVLARHELDAVRGTHGRAQPARHTLGLAVLRREHSVRAAPARRERPFFLRILHGDLLLKHVLQGEAHSLERRTQVAGLLDGTLEHLHANRHYRVTSTAAGSARRMRAAVAARSCSR